jgi:hypothetical protein
MGSGKRPVEGGSPFGEIERVIQILRRHSAERGLGAKEEVVGPQILDLARRPPHLRQLDLRADCGSYFRLWHKCEVSAGLGNVCCRG